MKDTPEWMRRYFAVTEQNDVLDQLKGINKNEGPKYRSLATALKQCIETGILQKDERLPSENQMFSELGLSRSTIRKALELLEEQDLVYRRQGQGTFVKTSINNGSSQRNNNQSSNPRTTNVVFNDHDTKSMVMGVLIPSLSNEIYPEIVEGVEQVVRQNNGYVIHGTTNNNSEREADFLKQFIYQQKVDGIIIDPVDSAKIKKNDSIIQVLEKCPIPYVLINNEIPWLNSSAVMLLDKEASKDAVNELIELGHRNIAIITNINTRAGQERLTGYMEALEDAKITVPERFIQRYEYGDSTAHPGYRIILENYPDSWKEVTAVVCYNDDIAIEVLQAYKELNIRIPQEVSVLGFDNISKSRTKENSLSTIDHPRMLMGKWAADLLLRERYYLNLHGNKPVHQKVWIKPALILRNSIAKNQSK